MIPTQEKIEEISNIPGKEVLATIGDPRMVMKSLTKLYSNTALATIREYSTNARDANVEAGRADVPIEVTLPTILNPYFIVKDTGIGLSTDELEAIYVSYGTSTKRNSNDFNGMLGFGSKSALAYTNTFTVTAVKDGVETIAIITRKEDYTVSLKIVSTKKTDKINGVTVRVPVQNPESFSIIAMDFYRFWERGTILIDGNDINPFVGEKIDEGLYYAKSNTSYVVMGNVGYRVENPDALFTNKKLKAVSFVAYVPNGSVEFTPSREDLEYSEATKKTLYEVVEKWEKKMHEKAKEEIDNAKNQFEAYQAWVKWSNQIGIGAISEIEYEGNKFSNHIDIKQDCFKYDPNTWRKTKTEKFYAKYDALTVSDVNSRYIVVHSIKANNMSSAHKAGAVNYAALKGLNATSYILTQETIDNPWVNPERCISWTALKSHLPKATKAPSNRVAGSYDYWCSGMSYLRSNQPVPTDGMVFYVTVDDDKRSNVLDIIRHNQQIGTDGFDKPVYVLRIPRNRLDKFKREYPKIENFLKWAYDTVELDGESLLDDDQKMIQDIEVTIYSHIFHFFTEGVIDPDWIKYGKLKSDLVKNTKNYDTALRYASAVGRGNEFKRYDPKPIDIDFEARYPLLSNVSGYFYRHMGNDEKQEWIAYMNDAYRRRVDSSA